MDSEGFFLPPSGSLKTEYQHYGRNSSPVVKNGSLSDGSAKTVMCHLAQDQSDQFQSEDSLGRLSAMIPREANYDTPVGLHIER